MHRYRLILIWLSLLTLATVPLVAALMSPLLAWRQPVYIVAGVAGVFALVLLLFQPLLARGLLPGFSRKLSRIVHRRVGVSLVLAVIVHVAGLWITSPPDVIDALLFRSATPFAPWGVISMWSLFISGCLVATRPLLTLRGATWSLIHQTLAAIIVVGSVVHVVLIDGTMEVVSKWFLCAAVVVVTLVALKRAKPIG